MILSAKALLDENPHPAEEEIKKAISGVLCRCGSYRKIIAAVQAGASMMGGEGGKE
jgi:carbon-monoxide dehydrogenase small subunit